MRVALLIRRDGTRQPGGDVVQAQKTAAALRDLGVAVDVVFGPQAPGYDVYHLFNLTRLSNSLEAALWARRRGYPYVVSPIWHSLEDMRAFYSRHFGWGRRFPIVPYLALKELMYERDRLGTAVLRAAARWRRGQAVVLAGARMVLPNSPQEAEVLQRELGVRLPGVRVVPNAVDLGVRYAGAVPRERVVVCPGRIEPRKNTLAVVHAFLGSELARSHRLVLLGAGSPRHSEYVRRVMRHVRPGVVECVGHVPFEQAQRTYAAAELVVLASYFETTGLVGLEGLYQGARVVMTRRSYNDFYYGRRVTYCDPYDEGDIARALVAALREPVDPPEDGYFGRFSWPAAAAATRSAYEAALEQAEA